MRSPSQSKSIWRKNNSPSYSHKVKTRVAGSIKASSVNDRFWSRERNNFRTGGNEDSTIDGHAAQNSIQRSPRREWKKRVRSAFRERRPVYGALSTRVWFD